MKNYNPNTLPSITFYSNWVGMFRMLDLYDSAILLNWMFWYCFEEAEPEDEDMEHSSYQLINAWEHIKPQLDTQLYKWQKYCEKLNQ